MGRPHYDLAAWQETMRLARATYEITRSFPKEEIYGLSAQMRRAAVSVPSNIAEGAARTGRKEFAQFLGIAKGSLSELETQLLLAADLGYVTRDNEAFGLAERVARLLTGLHKKALS
ncbi:MAG: four helix bundle protein [Burkholderiales bacterium]